MSQHRVRRPEQLFGSVWRNLGAGRGLLYWVLIGHWLVPIGYLVVAPFVLVAELRELLRGMESSPRHSKYPHLRLAQPITYVRTDLDVDALTRIRRGAPKARPIETWMEAEATAVRWMKHWGWKDARKTQSGADGGIDAIATGAVAQVKFWEKPVSRPDLQNLVGAAAPLPGTLALLFFSKAGYTTDASAWAESANVALFTFDTSGVPQPQNAFASRIAQQGFG